MDTPSFQLYSHALCPLYMKTSPPFPVAADVNGVDLNPVQDTPVATRKEDTYIHFSVDVEIQRHVEKLPKGSPRHTLGSQHAK